MDFTPGHSMNSIASPFDVADEVSLACASG